MSSSQELAEIYDAHASGLYAFLLNLTRNESDTRDLLQEVFLRLARQPAMLAGVGNVRHFLLRLAHNLAVDAVRRRAARDRRHDRYADERVELFAKAGEPDRDAFGRELAEALGALPEEQRAVVHLKLWEGLTFEEIAAALDISANTAASRYRYGIDKLRAQLRPFYDEINQA